MFSKTNLEVIDTGVSTAQKNMADDAQFLADLGQVPILHLYEWEGPSATYGHFIPVDRHVNRAAAERWGLALARRPTGGGIVFHTWDFAFSLLMPASHPLFSTEVLDNYKLINDIVLDIVKESFGLRGEGRLLEANPAAGPFCMAKPTVYDVVWQGLKVAGAAQRRTQRGYLHQGTISLAEPRWEMLLELLGQEVCEAMRSATYAPLGPGWKEAHLEAVRRHVREKLKARMMERL